MTRPPMTTPSTRFVLFSSLACASMVALSVSCGDDAPAGPTTSASSTGSGGGEGGGGGKPVAGGLLSRSGQSVFETSPAIAVVEGGRVAVAWVGHPENGPSHIGFSFSDDGGVSWSEPAVLASAEGETLDSPDLTADRGGSIHMSWLGYGRDTQGGHVYVASAANGESTFGEPRIVSDPTNVTYLERPRITAKSRGGLMVTYGQLFEGYSSLVSATSFEGGDWAQTVIPKGEVDRVARKPNLCAAPPGSAALGRTWVAYVLNDQVHIAYTDDDGATWPGGSRVSREGEPVSTSVACVGDGNEVWVAYGVLAPGKRYGEMASIPVAHSVDGGASWVDYVDAQDPEASPYFANIELGLESDGSLDLAYYSGAGQGDSIGEFRRTRWLQPVTPEEPGVGGGPQGKPSVVIHEPVGFVLAPTDDEWIGDSVGFVTLDGKLYTSYVDNSDTVAHIAFALIDP